MSSIPLFLKNFRNDPFGTIDKTDLRFHGFQLNVLRNDDRLRKVMFEVFFVPPLLAWVLLGSDSTADQVANMLVNIPNFLIGKIDMSQLINVYSSYYGVGTHWSAAVIYSLLVIGISRHFHDNGVHNSQNLSLTTGFVGLTIATFEFFWIGSYCVFQNQPWILSLQYPQSRIIIQNLLFATPGLIILAGLNWEEYKLNMDKITALAFMSTIGLILLWWYYPFPTTQLTVQTESGLWISSRFFPQTLYTIEVTRNAGLGTWFHIENSGVHLVNNLTKIMMSLTFYSLFNIKKKTVIGGIR